MFPTFVMTALLAVAAAFAVPARAQPAVLQGVALQDHRQQPLHKAGLQGQATLLHVVFTTCSSTCPTQVLDLAQVHGALPADVRRRLRVLSLTVDPLSDTPQALAAYARRLDADRPGWHFVTGAPQQVHRVLDRLQALDTRQGPAQAADHRTQLYLYDADGNLRLRLAGVPVDRRRLADELTQLARLGPQP
jgi:protein SCO1/2